MPRVVHQHLYATLRQVTQSGALQLHHKALLRTQFNLDGVCGYVDHDRHACKMH